jgi:hypothetical protein
LYKKDMNGIGIAAGGEEMGNFIAFIESLQGKVKIFERIAEFECFKKEIHNVG